MLVKLKSIGFVESAAGPVPGAQIVDRPCMLVYAGEFESATGPVTVTPEMLALLVARFNARYDRLQEIAGVGGNVPLKQCPPIQLNHSDDVRDTVGRVVGKLTLGVTTLEDGSVVPAVLGTARFLGAENCQRVTDGRWSSLSVGADFDEGLLKELSVVTFGAAREAALLTAGDENTEKTTPPAKEVAAMDPTKRAQLKAYLTGVRKMSEDDAEAMLARLEGADGADEMSKLAAECDEHEKKLAADEDERKAAELKASEDKKAAELAAAETAKAELAAKAESERTTRLAAARTRLTELTGSFAELVATSRLAAAKGKILTRLSRLRASAKITPAEIKKLDIAQLAATDEKAIEMVLATYDAREPVIFVGQLGSVRASSVAKLKGDEREKRMAKLEAESRSRMSLLSKGAPNSDGGAGGKDDDAGGGADDKGAPPFKRTEGDAERPDGTGGGTEMGGDADPESMIDPEDRVFFEREYADICQMMTTGKTADAAQRLKAFMAKCLGQAGAMPSAEQVELNSDETEKQLAALAGNVSAMQDKFNDLSKLAGELAGSTT